MSKMGVFEVHEGNPNVYYQFETSFDERKFLYCSEGGTYIRKAYNMIDIHEDIMNSRCQNLVKFKNANWVLIKSYEYHVITKLDFYGDLRNIFPLKPSVEELEYFIGKKISERKLKQLKLER